MKWEDYFNYTGIRIEAAKYMKDFTVDGLFL